MGKFILDFGCGTGLIRKKWLIEPDSDRLIGIDIDISMLRIAKKNVKSSDIVLCDGQFLPFRPKVFEYVRVWHVLHHLPNSSLALSEINRVLDGILDLTETVYNNPLFAIGVKFIHTWQGVPISSHLTSENLKNQVERFFRIQTFDMRDRVQLLLFYHLYNLHDEIPDLLKKLDDVYNNVLKKLKLMTFFVSSVKIMSTNKVRRSYVAKIC